MKVELQSITPNAEINIVQIARVSSSRIDKSEKPEGLINYLIRNKHWSPFQHSYLTFEITTSKAMGIQLLRHLSFTFQEFSQRYAEVERIEDIEFRLQAVENRQSSTDIVGGVQHLPDGTFSVWHENTDDILNELQEKQAEWLYKVEENLTQTLSLYQEGLKLGIAKECARMILPIAAQTTIYMTGSVRSWIHFLQIRLDEHAQKEVRLLSAEIRDLFKFHLPIIGRALSF